MTFSGVFLAALIALGMVALVADAACGVLPHEELPPEHGWK